MEELNALFNDYMNEFKKKDTKEKRNEIINNIKEIIVAFEQLALQDNIKLHFLKNNEINDLNKQFVSEDDFLEAELVYLEVAKNIIGQYLDEKNI